MRSYTVTEFTSELKSIINGAYDDQISISGEVSGFSRSTAGHIYFDLKDENSKIRVAYFRNYNIQHTAVIPNNGDKVDVFGMVDIYSADGSYSLRATRIIYKSEGELYLKFIETKKRLELLGLFDESRKKPIPKYPTNVAVVTSLGAAALKDFLITAKKMHSAFNIEIFPTPVQGIQAKADILKALQNIEKFKDRYSVVVITRGGGSVEDLSIFNDEDIAVAISKLSLPTISAIGHERDFTIADFVADKRSATPTAAATLLTEGYTEINIKLQQLDKKLKVNIESIINQFNFRLDIVESKLKNLSPDKILLRLRDKITIKQNRISSLMSRKLSKSYEQLAILEKRLLSVSPNVMVSNAKNNLNRIMNRLEFIKEKKITFYQNKIDNLKSRLELLNPYNVLDRGYAIVMQGDNVISDKSEIKSGDIIDIRLKHSEIKSRVIDSKIIGG